MRVTTGLIFLAMAVLGVVGQARADWAEAAAILTCQEDENSFIVRFGRKVNDAIDEENFIKLPSDLAADSFMQPRDVSACTLKNGTTVSFASAVGQVFAYSQGGADPSGSITLSVDGNPVYYHHTFYAGYGSAKFSIGALIYRDGVLRQCDVTQPKEDDYWTLGTISACGDVSPRLSGQALTDQEKSALAEDQKRKVIAANVSPECKALRAQPREAAVSLEVQSSLGKLSEYKIDIDNDGIVDRVIRLGGGSDDCASCGNHYFDGSILVAFPGDGAKADTFAAFLAAQDGRSFDLETLPELKRIAELGGYVVSGAIPGVSIRYVYNVPFMADGKTRIYAFTSNREMLPPAIIAEVSQDHALRMLCQFDAPDDK